MQIVSRKLNEEFALDESVHIRVVGLGEGRVSIAVTAPDNASLHRVGHRPQFDDAGDLDCESMIIAADPVASV